MHPIPDFAAFFLPCLFVLAPFHNLKTLALGNVGSLKGSSSSSSLDDLIRIYAYKALVRPQTGVVYTAQLPSNMSGIRASIVRLRTGSFRRRGFEHLQMFRIPSGLSLTPFPLRMALVYQDLGNWSSIYYSLPGYRFLTPIVGLLAYDASDLTSSSQKEVEVVPKWTPILIEFGHLSTVPGGLTSKCVQFHTNGSHRLADSANGSICKTWSLGHFSLVVGFRDGSPVTPASQPTASGIGDGDRKKKFHINKTWTIVGILLCVLVALLLVVLLMWVRKLRRWTRMGNMVKRSDKGEVFKSLKVGSAYLPVASVVRTRPALENEHAP